MSTNINHSKMERALDIECAVMARNPKELYRLAMQEKKEGNDEQAEFLLQMYEDVMETIREAQEEMQRGDEEDYKSERETYYAESYRDNVYHPEPNYYDKN